jgi:hypothetical protein
MEIYKKKKDKTKQKKATNSDRKKQLDGILESSSFNNTEGVIFFLSLNHFLDQNFLGGSLEQR